MFEPPPPPDTYQPPQAPYVLHKPLSQERQDVIEKAEANIEAAKESAKLLAIFLKAARQGDEIRVHLDTQDRLLVHTRNSDGNESKPLVNLGNVWDALAERGIDIQPKTSEVVRFRIGEEIEVAATVKLHEGFFVGRMLLLPSFQVRWLSLEERVAWWYASLIEEWKSTDMRVTWLHVTYKDSNGKEIHEDKIDVYDVLTKSGIKLQPKGSAVIRFALGADLMEATVELEVGFLGFSRKLKLLSVERKRGEAWRLSTPEKETP